MNDLNSVIITGRALVDWENNMPMVVMCHRCWHEGDKMKEKNIFILVVVEGENLLETCRKIHPRQQVRVVGRLEQEDGSEDGRCHIVAEQVEVKL